MRLPIEKFREMIFQILFADDYKSFSSEIIPLIMSKLKVSKRSVKNAAEFVEKVKKNKEEIDQKISFASHSYELKRISSVEKNLLRLAIYELFFENKPPKVIFAEAIRLCRKFGSPQSAGFVNAVLDFLYKNASDQEK